MDVREIEKLWLAVLGVYGPDKFHEKIYEELFELGQAVAHFRSDKVEYIDLAEEIADVYMQLEKLVTIHSHVGMAQVVVNIKKKKYLDLQRMVYGKEQ